MSISNRRLGPSRTRSLSSSSNPSQQDEIEAVEKEAVGKVESFSEKFNRLKESREKLQLFIAIKDPTEPYVLDLKKYEHNIVDPRTLHVKCNGDILALADSSIKKMHVNKKIKKNWSKEDIIILAWLLDKYGKQPDDFDEADWKAIAELIPGKDHQQSMFKWMSLRNTRKSAQKKDWKPRQEIFLKNIVEKLGTKSWFEVSKQLYHHVGKQMKLYRSPKHCRERVKKGPWKPSEDIILLKEFLSIGKKWSNIAKKLNGRTQNAIKNRFTLLLDKKSNLYKNMKNAISDESYIAGLIENLEVGLMISTEELHDLEQAGDDQTEVSPKKEETYVPSPVLKHSNSMNESYQPSKENSFYDMGRSYSPDPHNDIKMQMATRSADTLLRPLIVRFEKLTFEHIRALKFNSMKPAVFNGESLELLVKEEQPVRDIQMREEEPPEPVMSDEEVSLPMINLDMPSGNDMDEFTSLPHTNELW